MKRIVSLILPAFFLLAFSQCKKNSGSGKPKKAIVTTIAGTGEEGYLDATAAFAKFSYPRDVAVHIDGTLYITDYNNRRIRKLTPQGQVHTVAGTGSYGNTNGNVTMASFKGLRMIALDATGNLYILDDEIGQVRKITGGADVSAFAGTVTSGFADGRADSAQFGQCWGITIDVKGNIYMADTFNERIRKIANGYVTTVAGAGIAGYLDGNALASQFNKPSAVAVDKQGNLYVTEWNNYRIRKITPAGTVSTFAGSGTQGLADGSAATAQFNYLHDMVIDSRGNLYVADTYCIRKITPDGEVSTIAGSPTAGFADGEGSLARFQWEIGLAIDAAGNIYVADPQNNRIRKITFE